MASAAFPNAQNLCVYQILAKISSRERSQGNRLYLPSPLSPLDLTKHRNTVGTRCHPSCRRRLRVVVKQGGLRSGFLELPLAVCQSQSSKPGSDGCADSPVEGKFKLRGILVSLRLSRHGHPILAHRFNGGVETGVGQKVPSGTKDERCFLKGVRSLQS